MSKSEEYVVCLHTVFVFSQLSMNFRLLIYVKAICMSLYTFILQSEISKVLLCSAAVQLSFMLFLVGNVPQTVFSGFATQIYLQTNTVIYFHGSYH